MIKNRLKRVYNLFNFGEQVLLTSIFNYCQNEVLVRGQVHDLDRETFYRRIYEAIKLQGINEKEVSFCRVGRAYDGGYIMVNPFSETKIAYSFGISDDVSWDEDMAKHGYDVYMYDHTIKRLPTNNKRFHWKRQGITGIGETNTLKTLETIVIENGHDKTQGMVLKMDVEGAEWEVLCNIDNMVLCQFDQIVIELHDLNELQNQMTIIKALNNLMLNHIPVHVHANNMQPVSYCGQYMMPNCLELTLLYRYSYEFCKVTTAFPTTLDMPNYPYIPDIQLGKWNHDIASKK